jgi:hypothetical protein
VRPGELAVLGVGLAAVAVAGLTWADAGPWPASPVRALAAGPGGLGGGDVVRAAPKETGSRVGTDRDRRDDVEAAAQDDARGVAAPVADVAPVTSDEATGTSATTPDPGTAAATARPASLARAAAGSGAAGAGVGRICLMLAPDAAYGAGHNGWAVRLADGRWLEGATENNTPNEVVSLWDEANDDGSFYVEPDGDTDSWMRTVTSFAQVRADFRGRLGHAGRALHDAGYYTTMRCGDVPGANPEAAVAKAREVTASGYWVGEDNCLTKAVDVFTAYGAHLPDATWELPNDYAEQSLRPLGQVRPI